MYKSIDIKEKAADFEKRVREYWQKNDTEKKSIENREGKEAFVFFEGPPTANGKPGIHHMMSRAIKDTICRYKTMQGFQVKRKAGWDTHGLPVEIEVEKQLGLKDKKGIEDYGIEPFNKKCRESVFSYEKEWREMTRTMGYWLDLDNAYITLKNEYIETVWWILNQFHEKGLIYKGHKIVPYCPSCGTPLSSHEVAQGYKDAEDPSVFIKFKMKDVENTYFLAWTTTPWTLISNAALVVHPDEKYVKIKHNDEYLILAKERLSVIDGEYEEIEEYVGNELEYKEYEPLFSFVKPETKAWFVGLADYVTMGDGTGIVHTAPAFGQDDYNLGRKYNLPVIQPVDGAGKFTEQVTDWKGEFVKDADKSIIRNLKDRGLLYRREQILHTYPFCWRCDSPLLYFARSSWYIKTTEFKEQLINNNKGVNWYPSFVGEKRFGEWLENNVDWALSRDRFWGTPLNLWICKDCGERKSIGSIADLVEHGTLKNGEKVTADIDLHRPYVDDVQLTCSCGGKMERTPEVIDCWFDSGAMPFAQWHYPFENKDRFDKELFPADFICEGIDQTRGWFYSLLAISTFVTGKAPYKNVLVNDLILDAKGKKMSKRIGNTVNPMEMMDKYGADAIRWFLLAVSPPWVPTKFDVKGVQEIVSKLINTLKNVYSFYATYANIDSFDALNYEYDFNTDNELDKWILSRLNTVVKTVQENNDKYDLTRSVRLIQSFVLDDISNWYVRRSRRRYWEMTVTEDKKNAYMTLWYVLSETTKMMAPFAPYISEEIYGNLNNGKSVHLQSFPAVREDLIDVDIEKRMKAVVDVVTLGRAARNTSQLKVRQTLGALYVPEAQKKYISAMEELVKEEINVKEIKYMSESDSIVSYTVKPNFKTIGPKYGKFMKAIQSALQKTDPAHILAAFNKDEKFFIEAEGQTLHIEEADLIFSIQEKEGFVFEKDKDIFVALDTKLTEELINEGYARELVNKIQFTRKDSNFDIMDRIVVHYFADEVISKVFEGFGEYIKSETLTNETISESEVTEDMQKWDINGKEIHLLIKKA